MYLGRGFLILQQSLLRVDHIEVTYKPCLVAIACDLFGFCSISDRALLRCVFAGQVMQRGQLIFNLLVGDHNCLFVLEGGLPIRRFCLVDVGA